MDTISNIGVFFGGKSPEHDISIITGLFAIGELKKLGIYDIIPIYLDKDENFFIGDLLSDIKIFSKPNLAEIIAPLGDYNICLKESKNKIVFVSSGFLKKKITIDLAFPAFHGHLGEDGSFQGLFNIFNIPYVGCDLPSSALAMDKILTKQMFKSLNIPTSKFMFFTKNDWIKDKQTIQKQLVENLHWPIFIKPPHLGSSIGIIKVKDIKDLENACEVALHYDNKFIAEESIENLMDVTCVVMGNQKLTTSLLQESAFTAEFFNYEDKYLNEGGAQIGNAQSMLVIPARVDDATTKQIQELSKEIFKAFGCSGIARIDYLYNKITKEFFANEINPLPGTLYFHLWNKSGIETRQLLESLIEFALEKHKEEAETTYSFSSEVLTNLNSIKTQIN